MFAVSYDKLRFTNQFYNANMREPIVEENEWEKFYSLSQLIELGTSISIETEP